MAVSFQCMTKFTTNLKKKRYIHEVVHWEIICGDVTEWDWGGGTQDLEATWCPALRKRISKYNRYTIFSAMKS